MSVGSDRRKAAVAVRRDRNSVRCAESLEQDVEQHAGQGVDRRLVAQRMAQKYLHFMGIGTKISPEMHDVEIGPAVVGQPLNTVGLDEPVGQAELGAEQAERLIA